jgi:hypothetical protein
MIDMSNKVESHNSLTTATKKIPGGEDMQEYLDSYKEVKAREWDMIGSNFEFVLNDIPERENAKGNGPYSLNGYSSIFIIYLNCTKFNFFSLGVTLL